MSDYTDKHVVGLYDLSKLTKNELIHLIDRLRFRVKQLERDKQSLLTNLGGS